MNTKGIKLNYLLILTNNHLQGKSSYDIVEEDIKPQTADQGCSYVEYLLSRNETQQYVKEANTLVSYSWSTSFVDVVNAVSRWARDRNKNSEEIVVWMDMFSSNKHRVEIPENEDLINASHSIIEKMDSVLVYLSPWNDPIPFTRSWCLWEIYLALKLERQFNLIFSEQEENKFAQDISQFGLEPIKKMIGVIDSRRSESSVVEEQESINSSIEKQITFEELDKLVQTAMQQSLIDVLKGIIQKERNPKEKGLLLSGLAALYAFHGKLSKAIIVCEEAIDLIKQSSDASQETLYERVLLGELYLQQGNWEEASRLLQICDKEISNSNSKFGVPFPPSNLKLREPYQLLIHCRRGLGEMLMKRGKYEDAEVLLGQTFAMLNVKNYYPSLIGLLNLLTESYEKQGKFELAERLYHFPYFRISKYYGEKHPDTLKFLYKLATVYHYRDQPRSEGLFRKCLIAQQSGLPRNHPDILKTAVGLAILLTKMSRFKEAEKIFRNIIKNTRSSYHHEISLSYGRCLMEQDKFIDAEPFFTEALTIRERVLGNEHPDTLIAMKHLIEFHQRCGSQTEANELNQKYIQLRRASVARFLRDSSHDFLGIKLSFLENFVAKYGEESFQDKQSKDVKQLIINETIENKCSYCEMLGRRDGFDSNIGKATVFVSHYWGNNFTQLIAILKQYFSSSNDKDPYLWIDLFSFNQHITTNFNFFGYIEAIIAHINNTVMVFEAWNSCLPLTRAWCIWELYCTIDTNSKFTIAFREVYDEVAVDPEGLDLLLDSIKCEESKCEFERDRIRIYETILRSITFPKLNTLIKRVIKDWILQHT